MQVILMEKVGNLGNLGEIVKVKDGYARNYLIPQPRLPSRNSKQNVPNWKKPLLKNWLPLRPRVKKWTA